MVGDKVERRVRKMKEVESRSEGSIASRLPAMLGSAEGVVEHIAVKPDLPPDMNDGARRSIVFDLFLLLFDHLDLPPSSRRVRRIVPNERVEPLHGRLGLPERGAGELALPRWDTEGVRVETFLRGRTGGGRRTTRAGVRTGRGAVAERQRCVGVSGRVRAGATTSAEL